MNIHQKMALAKAERRVEYKEKELALAKEKLAKCKAALGIDDKPKKAKKTPKKIEATAEMGS